MAEGREKNDLGKVLWPNYLNGPRGLVFRLLFRKRGKNSSGPRRLPLTFGLSGRRTRFAGPIERHFSHGVVGRRPTAERFIYIHTHIYIYTIIQDRKRQIESFIPMTHTPLFLLLTLIGWVYKVICIYTILYQYIEHIYIYTYTHSHTHTHIHINMYISIINNMASEVGLGTTMVVLTIRGQFVMYSCIILMFSITNQRVGEFN